MATTANHRSNRSFGQSSRASTSTQPYDQATAGTQQFVIGKIDAGIAVLISDSVHLIEFPSLLLPAGVGPGSIVNIACTRNFGAERAAAKDFWDLQREIKNEFGQFEPQPPRLKVRNTTQTSVTLEWDRLELASANLISLSIFRNGQRLTTIPSPLTNTSTKLSGLQLDTDYSFHLVLKTSAGTFASPTVKTRTHTIDNTSGISVCFGVVEPSALLDQAKEAVSELGAKWDDKIQIDTTHFVATSSASRSDPNAGPGVEYQKAVQLSIPVVSPEWLLSCHRSSKMVPISAFYLGTTNHAASLSSAQLVSSPTTTPATPARQITSVASVREEPEPTAEDADSTKVEEPPVRLEENVEQPPEDQRAIVTDHKEAEDKGEEPSTDSSTQAVKSEVEEEPAPIKDDNVQEAESELAQVETEREREPSIEGSHNETTEPVQPSNPEPEPSVPGDDDDKVEPTEVAKTRESVDLDDAFEDTEIVTEPVAEDPAVVVEEPKVESKSEEQVEEHDEEGYKSLVDVEL
ncbi:uncharacterized protein JCM15063_000123 [Sporobolomyces koalae]|uniref:uncharacterized protein n=1 Tax=Sporobolomyces koalae TaxID=500713 RepID=UPI00317E8527